MFVNDIKQEFNQELVKVIIKKREDLGMSKRAFAKLVGISHNSYFCFESGRNRIDIPTLIKIMKASNIPFEDVLKAYDIALERLNNVSEERN